MNNNVIEPTAVQGVGTENQESDMTAPVWTFRRLNSTDVFLMCKIIGKIGINEFNECFSKDSVKGALASLTGEGGTEEGSAATVGFAFILEAANIIIGNLPKCEQEIYQMLSNTSNLTVKQVKELDFADFFEMVIDFIKKEEFQDFIQVASKLFK